MDEDFPAPLDLRQLKVYPLSDRKSLTRIQDILLEPADDPRPLAVEQIQAVDRAAAAILQARKRSTDEDHAGPN